MGRIGILEQGCDLSVILTAHDETLVCGPTVTAAEAAIAVAEAAGMTVERIVVLDNATEETRLWYAQPALGGWTRVEIEEGDLGMARNAILPRTRGRYIAFLDADDLFSENWLRDGVRHLREADAAGQRAIAHPELNWLFDGGNSVYFKPGQDDPLFTPWHFYAMNYYDSLCMAPREAHLEHPYVHRDIPAGLSYQDWHFAIETMAARWKHISVPDTIIFKRRRDESLVSESRERRSLVRQIEAMAIDRVGSLGSGAALPAPESSGAGEGCNRPVQPQNRLLRTATRLLKRSGYYDTAPIKEEVDRTPHYGAAFAEQVARSRPVKGRVPEKLESCYALVEANFDVAYYLARYGDIRRIPNFDPVAHYLRAGWKEGRDPTPWFSARAYLDRYPEVRESKENPFVHWLTTGWKTGHLPRPVRHFDTVAEAMGLTPEQALTAWRRRYHDLQERLAFGTLGAQVKAAAKHDPLIELSWSNAFQVRLPPFHSDVVCARTAAMWRLSTMAGGRRSRHVICVNRARFGGAARVEGHLAQALSDRDGAETVLLVTTDRAGELPEGKLPDGVRHVDFAGIAGDLRPVERTRMLVEFLRAQHPEAVFNVNSRLLWEALVPYGKALAASMRLYGCLLCNEQTPMGYWSGYPLRQFYRHFAHLSGIFTDSVYLAKSLEARYLLPADWTHRLQVLPNPVDPSIPVAPRPDRTGGAGEGRPQVFWAGRFDRQKRPDLVVAIAEVMPEVDFRLWGERVMDDFSLPEELPDNVHVETPYDRFADLPLGEADLWLYTSAWDGVPTMLLEVAMTGLPVVGGAVEGSAEVLPETALPPEASIPEWAAAIRAVLADPDGARDQALDRRAVLLAERTPEAHGAALGKLLEASR